MKRKFKKYIFMIICIIILLFLNKTINYASSINYIYSTYNMPLMYIESQLGEEYDDLIYLDLFGKQIKDYWSLVKTGVTVRSNSANIDYQLVVRGDINGDGEINSEDNYLGKSHIIGLVRIRKSFFKSC